MITPEDRDHIHPPQATAPDPWERVVARPSESFSHPDNIDVYVYRANDVDAAIATERSAHVAELEQLKAEIARRDQATEDLQHDYFELQARLEAEADTRERAALRQGFMKAAGMFDDRGLEQTSLDELFEQYRLAEFLVSRPKTQEPT